MVRNGSCGWIFNVYGILSLGGWEVERGMEDALRIKRS